MTVPSSFILATLAGLLAVRPAVAASPHAPSARHDRSELRFGIEGSYGRGGDADARFGLGARVLLDLASTRRGLGFAGSIDYFRPEGSAEGLGLKIKASYLELNANLTHTFTPAHGARPAKKGGGTMRLLPYVGAGLNVARRGSSVEAEIKSSSSDIDLGVNVLGGLKLDRHLFGEVRYEIGGGEQLLLTIGFVF